MFKLKRYRRVKLLKVATQVNNLLKMYTGTDVGEKN